MKNNVKEHFLGKAVYTIIPKQNIKDAYANNGRGCIAENKMWVTASNDLDECDDEQFMMLLLADASSIRGVEWVAVVDKIQVNRDEKSTLINFSHLTRLSSIFPIDKIKLRNGNNLSSNHIRPYVLCELPKILSTKIDFSISKNFPKELDVYKSETERQNLISVRTTQGEFRSNLLRKYKGCAVTGCDDPNLLIASHIVPWSKSTNFERQDVCNGLLLLANLDHLFDNHLISFAQNGEMLVSKLMTKSDALLMGLKSGMKLLKIESGQEKYLAKHRAEFWAKQSS